MSLGPEVSARVGDISAEFDAAMRIERFAAWDIETDGLDYRRHPIRTVQVHVPGIGSEIVRVVDGTPSRLADVLESERVTKVFHHAPFDLRFMREQWGVRAREVACTKVMAKIVLPNRAEHSLAGLVGDLLGVHLDKSQRLSNWSTDSLSKAQLEYALGDVVHLPELFRVLWKEALNIGAGELIEQSFDYLPTRVETEVRGLGDVFGY